MTISQLQILAVVVEEGSFTRAAQTLSMTQSAVSHALASLESELKVSLLERDRNGVRLTDVGQPVLESARTILAQAENIRQHAASARGLANGKVRVGSFASTSARLLPGIIREFRQQYPGVEVVLFEGSDIETYEWIQNRIVDVGFVTWANEGLELVPLAQDEMLVVLPLGHRLTKFSELSVAQFAHESFILSKTGCEPLIRQIFERAGCSLKAQYYISDLTTILAMVQEGLGITIIPQLALLPMFDNLEVRPLRPRTLRNLPLGVLNLEAAAPAVRNFVEVAQNWARTHDYTPKITENRAALVQK
jgi:DNA-binding transcriptional LysR family regulator